MVQNGAKYNRGLKRWELPPGSKPTARMGVQGGDGEDSIPPLGQKKAALMKDAERKAKLEAEAKRIAEEAKKSAQTAKKEKRNRKLPKGELLAVSSTTDGIKKLIKQFYLWDGDPVINPDGSVTSPGGKTIPG